MSEGNKFKPFISAEELIPEFSLRAVIMGAIFGIIFGAASVYLGLKVGLTVSASIPIAVLAISVFKKLGNASILESNIVQTIGSAGESVAAGVVFTVPALLFLAGGREYFHYFQIFVLALAGGILGVLFMIPLRRSLIVKEHGNLPYPEGTACADVLIAGEKGGSLAQKVYYGVGIAFLYKLLMSILGFWKDVPSYALSRTSYIGFMQTVQPDGSSEPMVIEYNCRMGDPETEIVFPRIKSDMVKHFVALAKGELQNEVIEIDDRAAATVIVASGGYPENYEKGKEITGLETVKDSIVFHAGTKTGNGKVFTNGGRVLAVTSFGKDIHEAVTTSNASIEKIGFEGKYYRKDIGYEFK